VYITGAEVYSAALSPGGNAFDPLLVRTVYRSIEVVLCMVVASAMVGLAHLACGDGRGRRLPEGGSLGTFKPGQMVKEFDEAVFRGPIGVIQGPVKTKFGYHLILVTARSDQQEA
jgi:hypothetical protein